jgi:gas vesicle protein
MYGRETNIVSILSAFLIGGMLGAGVALLVAPRSGQKTRAMLRDKGNELKNKAVESVEETRSRASQAIEDLTQQTREKAATLTQRGKDKVDEQTDPLRKKAKKAVAR